MTPAIAVLNGPNLDLLGEWDPAAYGTATLGDVEKLCRRTAGELGFGLDFRQTNHEGVLVDAVHELRTTVAGLVVAGCGAHGYALPIRHVDHLWRTRADS